MHPPKLAARESPPSRADERGPLRVLLLRAGVTADHAGSCLVGTDDPPLSALGRKQVAERRLQWEWADYVATSPFRRAFESTAIFTSGAEAAVDASLGPLNFGRWQGVPRASVAELDPIAFADWQAAVPTAQPPGGESIENFRTRIAESVERLFRTGARSPLVVSHGEVIREIVAQLSGEVISPESPVPSELVLLTRGPGARFRLGRTSSDPDPLRSPLERAGLSGLEVSPRGRSVGHFQLRAR